MIKLNALVFTIACALFVYSCNPIRLSDRINVFDNEKRIYHFTKDSAGSLLSYNDTLICKVIVRRGVLRSDFIKRNPTNYDVFYFETPNHPDTGARDIFTYDIPVSAFTYCFVKGDLYVADYNSIEENPVFMPMKKVFPTKLKIGQTYTYQSSDYMRYYTLLKREDFFWGKMLLKDVLKMSISFDSRQGLKTTDTVWLAKRWGVVKWKKIDGYTGLLVE